MGSPPSTHPLNSIVFSIHDPIVRGYVLPSMGIPSPSLDTQQHGRTLPLNNFAPLSLASERAVLASICSCDLILGWYSMQNLKYSKYGLQPGKSHIASFRQASARYRQAKPASFVGVGVPFLGAIVGARTVATPDLAVLLGLRCMPMHRRSDVLA